MVPEHVRVVQGGNEMIAEWRRNNPEGAWLDLSGLDNTGANFSGLNLSRVDFKDADLRSANFSGADLRGSNFYNADLKGADFNGTKLESVSFVETDLDDATFYLATATSQGWLGAPPLVNFAHSVMNRARFDDASFRFSNFKQAILTGASFRRASLSGASFEGAEAGMTDFESAILDLTRFVSTFCSKANFKNASFRHATLDATSLTTAMIAGADFYEATLTRGNWSEVRGASLARNLEATNPESAPAYFDHCERTWLERWCSWERLKTFGRLPLFTASWTGFAFVASYVYVIAWHNEQVRKLAAGDAPKGAWLSHYVHELPLPSQTLLLFISTVLLAGASTIYSIWCPGRIREFSQEKWCDELKRSLLHYWPFAWQNPRLRLACGLLYVTGAACAVVVIVWKIGTTGRYILENTRIG